MLSAVLPTKGADTDHAFRVVVAYDDYSSGRRAMDTYQRLQEQFNPEFDFHINLWSFGFLQCPELNQDAVHDAASADAIILATGLRGALPAEIEQWINAWVPRRWGRTGLLVALLRAPLEPSRARGYLEGVAARAGLDFLAQEIRPGTEASPAAAPPHPPNGRLTLEGWGLNE